MAVQTRLFVGNLPENIKENELQSAFSSYGEITGLDVKTKPGAENDAKKFAFVTISSSNYNIESCIRHFSSEDFNGQRLYVTRARESFLERLNRERQQVQFKESSKNEVPILPKKNPFMKLDESLNPRKRKLDNHVNGFQPTTSKTRQLEKLPDVPLNTESNESNNKKLDSDKKRLESMKKKRQEFKEKQMIIKTGLVGIDKVPNKKVVFSDNEDDPPTNKKLLVNGTKIYNYGEKKSLFDEEDSDGDVNFKIKEQFEGQKGQKVLELQSRFKSDKRFAMDERFIEDDQLEAVNEIKLTEHQEDSIDVGQTDEKSKQLNILQDVLGITIKSRSDNSSGKDNKKVKAKLGMLRFDPMQPDHSKFLAPVELTKQESAKKAKKKKNKEKEIEPDPPRPEIEKVEVSKEQFYKVSETLKEAIAKPNTFSLRSLFNSNEDDDKNEKEQRHKEASYILLEKPKVTKVKNPLEPNEKNPFKYDSSDSEEEVDGESKKEILEEKNEVKAVWNEKLFFAEWDARLLEGLAFFSKGTNTKGQKERREMKSVMKKRLYNRDKKDQMFRKKIGGRRKGSGKKNFRKKRN